jgi:hypothetical protein
VGKRKERQVKEQIATAQETTVWYVLEVERVGVDGATNEKLIETYITSLEGSAPTDKYMNVKVHGHHYDTVTEEI